MATRAVWAVALLGALGLGLGGCDSVAADDVLRLPPGFPRPILPVDNPLTRDKVQLGRRLFYDVRLSANQTQSCGSCHQRALAFTDGLAQAVGSTGQVHPRSAQGLFNVAYAQTLTWANPLLRTLEEQALLPMFGERPVELGLSGREELLLLRLREDRDYPGQFRAAFPEDPDPVNLHRLTQALAAFERTIISGRSAYDRFMYEGQLDALPAAARRGMDLFFSERMECFHCHGGFNFSDATVYEGAKGGLPLFHNTGLYNVGGAGAYPLGSQGVYEISGKLGDRGRFRAPSLRNVALTAPYMHDGSVATLWEALAQHYERGGRLVPDGANAGDGAQNPGKSVLVRPFALTDAERADVLEFLRSLTDEELTRDPRLSDPADSP